MKIDSSSINGSLLGQTNQMALFSNVLSKNINNQIANLQEQLKKVNENKKLSLEERTKMTKQLNEQIESLGQLLMEKQAEMELKSTAKDPANEKDSENGPLQSTDPTTVSIDQMMAVLKGNRNYSKADTLNAIKTTLQNNSRILASEIEADAARGLDTAEKTEQLANIQAKIQTIDQQLVETAADSSQKNDGSGEDDDKKDEKNNAVGSGHLDIIV